ncbi:MAG: OmpA family protein [Leptospira sp.]|nr:OmpA family protein [Leptospira sp.]
MNQMVTTSRPKPTLGGRAKRLFLLLSLIMGLSVMSCSGNQVRYFFESEGWERFCGCAPKDKDASTFKSMLEALGEMEFGALFRVGRDNYLVRLYKGIKKAYEFEKVEFTNVAKEDIPSLEIPDAKDVIYSKESNFIFLKIIEVGVDHKSDLLVFDADQFFTRGSSALNKFALSHLDLIRSALFNYPESVLRIKVHTTTAYNQKANLDLSQARAKSIQKQLMLGEIIEEKRFRQVEGMGDKEKRTKETKLNFGNDRVEIFFETPEENIIDTYQIEDKKMDYEL